MSDKEEKKDKSSGLKKLLTRKDSESKKDKDKKEKTKDKEEKEKKKEEKKKQLAERKAELAKKKEEKKGLSSNPSSRDLPIIPENNKVDVPKISSSPDRSPLTSSGNASTTIAPNPAANGASPSPGEKKLPARRKQMVKTQTITAAQLDPATMQAQFETLLVIF